jgi:hypothetical protein
MNDESRLFPALAKRFQEQCFPKITARLHLDFAGDPVARDLAHATLEDHGVTTKAIVDQLASIEMQNRRPCIILAPGPSLDDGFEYLCRRGALSRENFIVAVDGAASPLIDRGAKLDAVVTDLDGLDDDQLTQIIHRYKATCFIHCHGNNLDRLNDVLRFSAGYNNCIFTTQVDPTELVANFGGFTDGDRAAFIAIQLGFTSLYLVSMDLDAAEIGAHSKPRLVDRLVEDNPLKKGKLQVASSIVKWLAWKRPRGCMIYTVNKQPPLPYLPNVASVP